jgi:predicted ABC-type ATPase
VKANYAKFGDLLAESKAVTGGKDEESEGRMARKKKQTTGRAKKGRAKKGKKPTVYVIAGPNGAGKTTFATEFLPDFVDCREFLNADLIAAGLSPFAPETENVRAGRLLLTRIRELAKARRDFGFETTLAGRSYARHFAQMRSQGYRIVLFFLWLPSADMAVTRVANRVRQGGHNVPEADIRRRFVAGIRNLFRLYRPLLNGWWLYDSSQLPPRLIAQEEGGKVRVMDAPLFERIAPTTKE